MRFFPCTVHDHISLLQIKQRDTTKSLAMVSVHEIDHLIGWADMFVFLAMLYVKLSCEKDRQGVFE